MKLSVFTRWPDAVDVLPSFDAERAAETAEIVAEARQAISEVKMRCADRVKVIRGRGRKT